MTRADSSDRRSPIHPSSSRYRWVAQWAEGGHHSGSDQEADPVGPSHRAGEHDPSCRRRPDQLPHRGCDVDPPVPRAVRPGPGIEASDDRSGHRHPQLHHRRWFRCGGRRRDGSLGHGCRRGSRNGNPDGQQRAEKEQRPDPATPNCKFGIRHRHGNSRQSRRRSAVVDCLGRYPAESVSGTSFAKLWIAISGRRSIRFCRPRRHGGPGGHHLPSAGPANAVSARPASSPGAGARPWCASGRRGTR